MKRMLVTTITASRTSGCQTLGERGYLPRQTNGAEYEAFLTWRYARFIYKNWPKSHREPAYKRTTDVRYVSNNLQF